MKARVEKEIHVETSDQVGVLAKVLGAVAAAKVDMHALLGYNQGNKAHFMVLTSDSEKAAKAIQKLNYTVTQSKVLVTEFEDKRGSGATVAKKLADAGINMSYAYAGSSKGKVLFIANTSDNEEAVKVLARK